MKRYALLSMLFAAILFSACGEQTQEQPETPEQEADVTEENPAEDSGMQTEESEPSEAEEEPDTSEAETESPDTEGLTEESAMEPYNGSDISFTSIEDLEGQFEWKDFGQGIKYLDVREGTGDVVEVGDQISAYYTLWLPDGTMLQTNVGSEPFTAPIGMQRLIKGWDLAVPGMKEGGIRRLIIPGDLAYGANPRPGSGIPPNATLVFELMVVETN